MPTVSQPKNLGDLLKYEAPNLYSHDLLRSQAIILRPDRAGHDG